MNRKTNKLLGLLAFTALGFSALFVTGCETIKDVAFDESLVRTTGTLSVDVVEVEPYKYVAVSDLAPGTYSLQQVIPAGTEVTIESVEMVPSKSAQTAIDVASGLLGPYGGLAGLIASGVLGIFGTIQSRRLNKEQRTAAALVQGVDTFRDILDQTPQGDKIDRALTEVLKERQAVLGVLDRVGELLSRYKTPTKLPIKLD